MNTFIDPVCGMTVDESALRLEGYEHVAFCAPGCRAAFLSNPQRYTSVVGDLPEPTTKEGRAHPHGCGQHVDQRDNDTGCCGGGHGADSSRHSADSAGHEHNSGES